MELKTDPNLRMLENREQIPENAVCYGSMVAGGVGWCNPGGLVGTRWKKHSIDSPSIIMATRAVPDTDRR